MDALTATDPGPFGIDGPEHSDRDREMFVLGYEFCRVKTAIEHGATDPHTIHAGNMARLRKVANGLGKSCWSAPTDDPTWVDFGVGRQY